MNLQLAGPMFHNKAEFFKFRMPSVEKCIVNRVHSSQPLECVVVTVDLERHAYVVVPKILDDPHHG